MQEEAPPAASEIPAWLRAEEPAGFAAAPSASDVPAWLQEEAPPAASEIPAWLRAEEPAGFAAAPPASDVPAWLQEEAPAPASDVPAWLQEEAPAPASDVPAWLQEEAPAPTSEVPAWLQEEAPPAASEIPAWLRAEEPAGFAAAPSASDVPAWLQEEAPAPASDVPAWLQEEAPAPTSDVPAWLQEEAPAPASDVPAWLQEEAPPAASEIPAWLRAEEPAGFAAAPSASDVPAWLQEEAPASDVPAWLQEEAPAPTSDVPAWLQEEAPASDVPAWLQEEAPPAASEIPAWLRAEEPAGFAAAPSASDVPAWLQEEAPAPASDVPAWLQEEAPAPASDVPAWLQEEAPASDVPAWLQDAAAGKVETPEWLSAEVSAQAMPWLQSEPSGLPAAAEPPPTTSSTSDEFFSGAELPPWLRASTERVVEPAATPSISWLQRLSHREAEVEEESVTAPAIAVVKPPLPTPTPRTPDDQATAIALLERLIQSPLPASVPVEQPSVVRRRLPAIEQWLAWVLLIAVLVGVLAPGLVAPLVDRVQPSPAAIALSERLAALGGDDVVLVAYEWGAQRVAELRPLEQAMLDQLIVDRTKLIIVSTDLQGALLSFDLIGPLRAAGYNNENGVTFGGRDYVLLGYRPGGELALRSIATDLRAQLRRDYTGQDATAGLLATRPDGSPRVQTLSDLSLIVVMADQVQDVQAWMEQIHSAAPEVPIAFLLPQEVYPQVLPYLRLPNVYAVAGQRGASDLLAAGVADETATTMLAVQTWATIAFVAALTLGGIVVIIGRLRLRGRRTA
ncbi:hypothetical protein [Chloroflexus sp.]|uniref:hypothetical protein n=1 Tax=Chloroflexus sp. TaxID=1904827 RepID=UPI002ACE09DA|nr:hypothetical protein [Chloroflexus sp.]